MPTQTDKEYIEYAKGVARDLTDSCLTDRSAIRVITELCTRLAVSAVELAEADRRAGAAERMHAGVLGTRAKHENWKRRAKEEAGYHCNTSFDVVWSETLASAKTVRALRAHLGNIADDYHPSIPRDADLALSEMRSAIKALLETPQ